MKALFPNVREVFALAMVLLIALSSGGGYLPAPHAGATDVVRELSGYAWGASYISGTSGAAGGIGWISTNSRDCDTDGSGTMSSAEHSAHPNCPAAGVSIPEYSVSVALDGTLAGYAWSSNLGWIQFGDLSGYPTPSDANGTTAHDAALDGGNHIVGWARLADGSADAWDGWISFSGTGYGVSVNPTTGSLSGYAWGGSNIGWISFSGAGYGVTLSVPPTLALTATSGTNSSSEGDPTLTVATNSSVYISWTSANTTSCVPSGGTSSWSVSHPATNSGSSPFLLVPTTPTEDPIDFTLTCEDLLGNQVEKSVALRVVNGTPDANLLASVDGGSFQHDPDSFSAGKTVRLRWSSNADTDSCTIDHYSSGSPNVLTGGSVSGTSGSVTINASDTYRLTCTNNTSGETALDYVGLIVGGGCADPNTDPATSKPFANGEKRMYYYKSAAGAGQSCLSQVLTCNNGTISHTGSGAVYTKLSCTIDPNYREH